MRSHRRGCSLSSLEGHFDFGLDDEEWLGDRQDENPSIPPPPPPSTEWTPRPLRRRLGAGEAIQAVSSPEIKALDLPLTPAFPRPQKHRNIKCATSPLPKTKISDTEYSVSMHYEKPPASPSIRPFCDSDNKENSSQQPALGNCPKPMSTPIKLKSAGGRKVFGNRSNVVHPNEPSASGAATKSRRNKGERTPSDRRLSGDSLPSPEDNGDVLTTKHSMRPKRILRERSLNVTTGFR